ncbi:DUF4397 domain-containing protein [Sphingobacterium sp.]|uniref:DUF4397 domain-containing protein n=1 Tax=Sphingobacterium sp. TaxID=341027 RepID=UPI0028AD20E1|nr:DUF4397 domain-containing protein [Sphingobacterium sp.]
MKNYRFFNFIAIALATFLLSSCLKDNDDQRVPMALFTMVNGYSDANAVIYYADGGALQNPNYPMEFKSYRPIVGLFTGARKIAVSAEYNSILTDTTITVKDSTIYTSFLFGTKAKPVQVITTDRINKDIKNTETGLRFFNFAEGTDMVSLKIGDQASPSEWTNRAKETQNSASAHQGFIAQKSGTFTVTARDKAGKTIATRSDIKLVEGYYYSLILIGKANDEKKPLYIGLVAQAAN